MRTYHIISFETKEGFKACADTQLPVLYFPTTKSAASEGYRLASRLDAARYSVESPDGRTKHYRVGLRIWEYLGVWAVCIVGLIVWYYLDCLFGIPP